VYKTSTCNLKHEKPTEGETKYYNFVIKSSAYPEKNINLWGYVNTINKQSNIGNLEFKTEKWITSNNPDFVWKKYKNNNVWTGKSKVNPFIDCRFVYILYKYSMSDTNVSLLNYSNYIS